MARLTAQEADRFRAVGWVAAAAKLPDALVAPARAAARAVIGRKPWQELLSGIHNPFGRHACTADAWKFLDIAESSDVIDLIEDVLGADIILWDSELYADQAALPADEPQWWPVEPLIGVIAVLYMESRSMLLVDVARRQSVKPTLTGGAGPLFALRYMSAACLFNRDPQFAANRRSAEDRVLINYAKRPLWLVRGVDRGENDFAVGFSLPPAQWAGPAAGGTQQAS